MAPETKPKPAPEPEDDGADLRDQIRTLETQMQALLQRSAGGISEDALERMLLKVAQVSAAAQQRAINPSNPDHLHIGDYTYPEGDLVRPRSLKCPMFWAGYDLGLDTTSAKELELLNAAQPGTYRYERRDGSMDTLTVTGEYGPDGKTLSKLLFMFQAREARETLPSSMYEMLRQAFGVQTDEQLRIAALEAQLKALGANLVTT